MGQLIYDKAAVASQNGRSLKSENVLAGSSAKVLRADERFKIKQKQVDICPSSSRRYSWIAPPMDFDSLAAAGSMAGSGGVIVLMTLTLWFGHWNNINDVLQCPRELRPVHSVPRRFPLGCRKSPIACCLAAAWN